MQLGILAADEEVGRDRLVTEDRVDLPVLGDVADASSLGRSNAAEPDLLTFDGDLAASGVGPGEHPGNSDDLAGVHGEVVNTQTPPAAQVARLQDDMSSVGPVLRTTRAFLRGEQPHHVVLGVSSDRTGMADQPVAQDDDIVGQLQDVTQPVRHDDHSPARAHETADQGVQGHDAVLVEDRRRLVEHEHEGFLGHGRSELDQLPGGLAQRRGRALEHVGRKEPADAPGGELTGRPIVDERPTRGLRSAEADVLPDREVTGEGRLLRHQDDARLLGRGQALQLPAVRPLHPTRGRAQEAGDHLEQCGLAGPVGSDDGRDCSSTERDVHPGQGLGHAVVLGHRSDRDGGLRQLGAR